MVTFSADGTSAVSAEGDALAVAKAQVAAATLAKANLLEKIKGARVNNEVRVADLLFKSEAARTAVTGWLSRATLTPGETSRISEATMITCTATLSITTKELKSLSKYVE
jgi:hypothetical protein